MISQSHPYALPWALCVAAGLIASSGTLQAKSVYLAADHHTRAFDAWNINASGTITKQATYSLRHSTDPAGIDVDVDSQVLFITSEFSGGVEMVDPVTLTYLGVSTGPSDLGGVKIDDVNDIVYTVRRQSGQLYIYRYDAVSKQLNHLAQVTLPNCSQAMGISLDETRQILWVADAGGGKARAYNLNVPAYNQITEITSLSFTPIHKPVDICVDRQRNKVYTVSMLFGWDASLPNGTGSKVISQWDVATGTERTFSMGHPGVGIAVDESSGFVYVTGQYISASGYSGGDNVEVWDPATGTRLQNTGDIGNPAGICIANAVSYNPLNLAKNGVIQGAGIAIGQQFTYTIACDNLRNPNVAATGVVITDTLPSGLDYLGSAIDGVPAPASAYDPVTHEVVWALANIPAGGLGPVITLDVRVNNTAIPGTVLYNKATIDSDQTPPTTVEDQDPNDPYDDPGNVILPCGDLDHDGDVDTADYQVFRVSLRACVGSAMFNPEADYDGDGCITLKDYKLWYACYIAFKSP